MLLSAPKQLHLTYEVVWSVAPFPESVRPNVVLEVCVRESPVNMIVRRVLPQQRPFHKRIAFSLFSGDNIGESRGEGGGLMTSPKWRKGTFRTRAAVQSIRGNPG
jgi:hypothetical protein